MRRREFIAGTAAMAAMSFTRPVYGQTDARSPGVKRIAIFEPTIPPEGLTINGGRGYKAFFGELNRLGYIEGQNLIVERHSGGGEPLDRYGDFARQIVASHPNVICPMGSARMVQEINALGTGIPMVGPTTDPVTFGISTNLVRPDRNFTGVVFDAGLEIWGKRFQLLLETARKLTKVGFFVAIPVPPAPGQRPPSAYVREAAQREGIKAAFVVVSGKFDRAAYERSFDTVIVGGENLDRAAYQRTFDLMEKEGVDGIIATDIAANLAYRQLIVDLAARFRIPAIYPIRGFVEIGGLMAYGTDLADAMRRVADMTDQVLRGTKPGDIPFYRQTKYELVLNQKAATALGLEFPATLLTAADEVIE